MVYVTDAETFAIKMEYDKNGKPYVKYGERKFVCDRTRSERYKDSNGCEVALEIIKPSEDQMRKRKGYVYGSRLCIPGIAKHW
ncbi:unnamed protein product [Dicrocoelium dendriticum]|nr:unnamed protein product [Dicrocoelium dendriticum]